RTEPFVLSELQNANSVAAKYSDSELALLAWPLREVWRQDCVSLFRRRIADCPFVSRRLGSFSVENGDRLLGFCFDPAHRKLRRSRTLHYPRSDHDWRNSRGNRREFHCSRVDERGFPPRRAGSCGSRGRARLRDFVDRARRWQDRVRQKTSEAGRANSV